MDYCNCLRIGEIMNDKPDEVIEVCNCYPDHCTEGDECWCEPEIIVVNDNKIIVHREVH